MEKITPTPQAFLAGGSTYGNIGFSLQLPAKMAPTLPASQVDRRRQSLSTRLRIVARMAQALPGFYIVPAATIAAYVGAMHDRAHVVGVGLPLVSTQPAAVLALPGVAGQHAYTPRLVAGVAVPTGCRVWAVFRLVGGPETRRPMGWWSSRHASS